VGCLQCKLQFAEFQGCCCGLSAHVDGCSNDNCCTCTTCKKAEYDCCPCFYLYDLQQQMLPWPTRHPAV
jgi:hypothetical protein